MRAIKKILGMCETDGQLFIALIGLFCAYVLVFGIFYNINWVCGIMSFYFTTSIIGCSFKLYEVLEKMSDDEDESK